MKAGDSEYDAAAAEYHWIYSDRVLSGEPFLEQHAHVLSSLPPGGSILDCACGIGIHAIALKRRGYDVAGADGSAGMVREAEKRARAAGLSVPFVVCRWEDLPRTRQRPFDLVFCCGNAIGHCRDADEMTRSLAGMAGVLKSGGRLVVDSRNWEKLKRDNLRVTALRPRFRDGARGVPVYFWTLPEDWEAPHAVEVALVSQDDDGPVQCRSHRVTYYPFRPEELFERMELTGFEGLETDFDPARDTYRVVGTRRGP